MDRLPLRRRVYYALEGGPGGGWLNRPTNMILALLILISVINLILETVDALAIRFGGIMTAVEQVSVAMFTLEYLARVWTATEDRDQKFSHPVLGRLRYMVSPLALIDLLAILPTYLGLLFGGDLLILRLFRLFRILRMVKLVRYSPALATLGVVLHNERRSWMAALLIMITVTVIASTVMWMLESEAQPEDFASIPHAMWWGVTTLTTVGYGDVTPITPAGKIFGALMQLVGIAMFTLPAAILASGFSRELRRRDVAVTMDMVRRVPVFADLDPSRLTEITALLYSRSVPPRYTVLRRGESVEAVYFIAEGEVGIDLPEGREIRLGRGDFFGEAALFMGDSPQANTVTALSDCHLLALDKDDFHRLMEGWPELSSRIAETVRRRQRSQTEEAPVDE